MGMVNWDPRQLAGADSTSQLTGVLSAKQMTCSLVIYVFKQKISSFNTSHYVFSDVLNPHNKLSVMFATYNELSISLCFVLIYFHINEKIKIAFLRKTPVSLFYYYVYHEKWQLHRIIKHKEKYTLALFFI